GGLIRILQNYIDVSSWHYFQIGDYMENGFVNFYDHVKGYGFIRRERGRDVFFRYDDFLFLGHDVDICKGILVRFKLEKTDKGFKAVAIQKV
ncbi:retron Se72 family effector protein, partial [Escherichia coli]|uniref:retron Se72 family effector protein n=4 Tax=Escherichia coli TaxID=562 RepID=UPI003D8FE080